VNPNVDAPTERHRMFAVRQRALLPHHHSRLDAARAADDARDTAVIRAPAESEFARIDRINRDDHSRLNFFRALGVIPGQHVEFFREIRAASDLQGPHRNQHIAVNLEPYLVRLGVVDAKQSRYASDAALECPDISSCANGVAQGEDRAVVPAIDRQLDGPQAFNLQLAGRVRYSDANVAAGVEPQITELVSATQVGVGKQI